LIIQSRRHSNKNVTVEKNQNPLKNNDLQHWWFTTRRKKIKI